MLALASTVALQCGQVRVAPSAAGRTALMTSMPRSCGSVRQARAGLPAKLHMTAHARACGDRDRARLYITGDDTGGEYVDLARIENIARELTGDDDRAGVDLAFHMRTRLDRDRALDRQVALEASGDADAAVTADLALDRQLRCE